MIVCYKSFSFGSPEQYFEWGWNRFYVYFDFHIIVNPFVESSLFWTPCTYLCFSVLKRVYICIIYLLDDYIFLFYVIIIYVSCHVSCWLGQPTCLTHVPLSWHGCVISFFMCAKRLQPAPLVLVPCRASTIHFHLQKLWYMLL